MFDPNQNIMHWLINYYIVTSKIGANLAILIKICCESAMYFQMQTKQTYKKTRVTLKKWLLAILLILISASTLAYLRPRKTTHISTPKNLDILIGTARLHIPENLVRDPEQRVSGNLNVINLAVNWPDFSPIVAPSNLINIGDMQAQKIFITIEPADETLPPEQRPSSLYSRFLTTDINDSQNQLVTRVFKAGSPYAGEVLHIAPPNGESFAARCQLTKAPEARPEHCLWQFRMSKLDVSVRFSEELLTQWDALSTTTRTVIENITVKTK